MGGEVFRAKGTVVKERNYLDIFKYERLAENTLPLLRVGEKVFSHPRVTSLIH